MSVRTCAARALALAFVCAASEVRSQPAPQAPRPVGNVNLITVGGGSAQFDHPNFESGAFPAIAFQRRVLRREMRIVPIWLRGALQYQSDDDKFAGYTVWPDLPTISPFPETRISERTRDIAFRGEVVGDVLHRSAVALYAGAGFVLHSLRFTSDGNESARPAFSSTLTDTSPSALFGLRVFAPTRPYTGYFEVRYGRVFGKTDDRQGREWLTYDTFQFTSVNAVFLDGGVGFHW